MDDFIVCAQTLCIPVAQRQNRKLLRNDNKMRTERDVRINFANRKLRKRYIFVLRIVCRMGTHWSWMTMVDFVRNIIGVNFWSQWIMGINLNLLIEGFSYREREDKRWNGNEIAMVGFRRQFAVTFGAWGRLKWHRQDYAVKWKQFHAHLLYTIDNTLYTCESLTHHHATKHRKTNYLIFFGCT